MDTYSIDRNLAAMSSGTAYAPTHIDSWCSGADWARYRFEKIVADLQKEIEELKSELHRAQEMRRIGENEMSAFGCCGEYNEHSPKCVTVKYQKALEMIETLKLALEHYTDITKHDYCAVSEDALSELEKWEKDR